MAMAENEAGEGTGTFERPGRLLIGWLPQERAVPLLAGRADADPAEYVERIGAAHASVAQRQEGQDEAGLVQDLDGSDSELAAHVAQVLKTDAGAAMVKEGWAVKLVDLEGVRAAQPLVLSDEAEARVSDVDAGSHASIAAETLPNSSATELPAQYDEGQRAWIISAPNPNLKIAGPFGGELQPGVIGFGFVVRLFSSFVSVAVFDGRHILRDGYHRVYGLLRRGITVVPAFVRDVPSVEAIGFPQGMIPQEQYLGSRPPRLPDYLDDDVSATVVQPVAQKMLVIQGLEITPIGQAH